MKKFKSSVQQLAERDRLMTIMDTGMQFYPWLRVSSRSSYDDSVWSWEDSSNPRFGGYTAYNLRIDWNALLEKHELNLQIIEELKRYAFLRFSHSTIVFCSAKNPHPVQLTKEIKAIAAFISFLRKDLSAGQTSLINSFSDIEVQDLENLLPNYACESMTVKRVLIKFGSEIFGKHLDSGPMKWKALDILMMSGKSKKYSSYERLPESLFSKFSNSATADVKQFLLALNIKTHDATFVGQGKNLYKCSFPNFKQICNEYITLKSNSYKSKQGALEFRNWSRAMRSFGGVGKLTDLIERARIAGQIIIMLYTGARLSEFSGFKVGCVQRRGVSWVIVGTVIKGRDIFAPSQQDEWAAIPIVRDAVNLLERIARISGVKHLFHGSRSVSKGSNRLCSSNFVARIIEKYLNLVDIDGQWKNFRLHSHQFRNALTYELRKAGLGLPFITYQLKHSYEMLDYSINDTTLNYGSIGNDAVQKAILDANMIAMKQLYHPGSPVTGGGAVAHRERREAYFLGRIHQGMTIDETLTQLAQFAEMPLTDVGLGYCQGKTKIMLDGVDADPPCIGQLRCNPVRCSNAVIPEYKLSAWRKSAEENGRRAQLPQFAYARQHLLEAEEEANAVIKFFQSEQSAKKAKKND